MKAKIFTDDLNRIIKATKGFVSGNDKRPTTQFIRLEFSKVFETVTAIAVDGYRLSVEHAVAECDEDFYCYISPSFRFKNNCFAQIELSGSELIIRCDGMIIGCAQPNGEFLNWEKVIDAVKPPVFRIGFNGNYLLSALQAAKASCGGSFKDTVVLEMTTPIEPIVLRTNKNDVKYVLPVILRE